MTAPKSFCLAEEFRSRSEAAETKAERTRQRLLAEATAMLDDVPFPLLRPADLAERAGISRGLIYHHFADLPALVTEIVEEFERRTQAGIATVRPLLGQGRYRDLVVYISWVLAVVLRNRGVMRLLLMPNDHLPEAKAIFDRVDFAMYRMVGDAVDAPSCLRFGARERLMIGYMFAGGFNTLLRELFVYPNERLPTFRSQAELFELVQLVATMRHRQLHAKDPSAREVASAAASFDPRVFDGCVDPRLNSTPTRDGRRPSMPRLRRMSAKAAP